MIYHPGGGGGGSRILLYLIHPLTGSQFSKAPPPSYFDDNDWPPLRSPWKPCDTSPPSPWGDNNGWCPIIVFHTIDNYNHVDESSHKFIKQFFHQIIT